MTTYEIAHELLQDTNAAWTYAGAFALAEQLQMLEEDSGEEMEFDHVALRCDYSEYGSFEDFREQYFADAEQCREAIGADEDTDEDDLDDLTREYIGHRADLIEFDGGIITSSF